MGVDGSVVRESGRDAEGLGFDSESSPRKKKSFFLEILIVLLSTVINNDGNPRVLVGTPLRR
jgi:hypothetical protein